MRCPNCRNIIEKNDLFCSSCGYYVPSYQQAVVHPYANQSNLPFISFLTGFISFLGSFFISSYFIILAIIGFFIGFYSILKYRRGIFGIVFNTFSMIIGVFLLFNPSLFQIEEESKESIDYFSFYYGVYECSSDKMNTNLIFEFNPDYTFQYLERKEDNQYYAYGTFSYVNQTEDIENANSYSFLMFFKAPENQYLINDAPVGEAFNRSGTLSVYGDRNVSGTFLFSSTQNIYFCTKVSSS